MSVGCIVLAAGFGTRLKASLVHDSRYQHLCDTPKPLLPLGEEGDTIAALWVREFAALSPDGPVVVVSNAAHAPQYRAVFGGHARVRLLDDGALSNETRLGAVADLALAAAACGECEVVVAVAGDTLLEQGADVAGLLRQFVAAPELDCLTVGYPMKNPARDCRSRGLLQLGPAGRVICFAEKPELPLPDALASAPLYLFRPRALAHMHAFLDQARERGAPLAHYDAPGFLLAHLVAQPDMHVRCVQIASRIDIGSLDDYIEALQAMADRKKAAAAAVI